jgi:hypothetical protein
VRHALSQAARYWRAQVRENVNGVYRKGSFALSLKKLGGKPDRDGLDV